MQRYLAILFFILYFNIKFAVLMPFTSGSKQDDNNMDFYSGVLMAAKRYGDTGLDIRINALDLKRDTTILPSAADSNDFILGPMRCEDISYVVDGIDTLTPVISPLDAIAIELAESFSNVVEAATQQQDQYRAAIEWAKEETSTQRKVNYIVVSCEQDTALLNTVKILMSEYGLPYSTCSCGVQNEITNWENCIITPEEGVNVAILAINNEAVLNNAVRNMSIYAKDGNTLVFTGSKIRSYETIPVECLHKARVHVLCPYFIDYHVPETMTFIHSYRALYNMEPSQYAYQGYDLGCYMIQTCAIYGKNWMDAIESEPVMNGIQASFKMKRIENGGLKNIAVRRILYDYDYTVKLIK